MDADGSNQVPFGTSSGYDADWQPLCTITGTIAGEMLTGTDGADVICGGGGNDTIVGGGGNDIIFGGDGSDKLDGGEGADIISGQGGNDTLIPGAGDDLVAGAGGADTVSYTLSLTPVSLSLTTGQATGEGLDTLVTMENAVGSATGDVLVGNKRANLLRGRAGGDRLLGADGNDVLGRRRKRHTQGRGGHGQMQARHRHRPPPLVRKSLRPCRASLSAHRIRSLETWRGSRLTSLSKKRPRAAANGRCDHIEETARGSGKRPPLAQ
jgi:Ca2+-binding RTX toxin-like protein